MNLGTYTDTLAALDGSLPVYFDNGLPVRRLISWRGRYNELTLDCGEKDDAPRTVADLLKDAKEADGKTFQGYKGGDYVMGRHTAVWADEWGEYHGLGIAGIEVTDGRVIVRRIDLGDYV